MTRRSEPFSLSIRYLSAVAVFAGSTPFAFSTEPPRLRRDRHGDPLPLHAIARLGTLRFRGVRGCLAFSPDGKRLATSTGKVGEHVIIWDMATGRQLRLLVGLASLIGLSFSPDGKRLVVSDNSTSCRVVDAETGKDLFELSGARGVFSADGKVIVTCVAGNSSTVQLWDAHTGKSRRANSFALFIQEFALAGDGRTMAVINQTLGQQDRKGPAVVKVLDLATGTVVRSFALAKGGWPRLTISEDGKVLASTNADAVRLWDMTTGKRLAVWNHSGAHGTVFSRDGKHLAWIGRDSAERFARLWVVELKEGKPRSIGEPDNYYGPLCFSPDGKRLAVVTVGYALSLYNVVDGKEAPSLDAHNSHVVDVAFRADGQQVVSRARNGALFAWQTRTGRLLRRSSSLPPENQLVASLLPNGYLLTEKRTNDLRQGIFRLHDPRTGDDIMQLKSWAGKKSPPAVAVSGGPYLAVHGRDGAIEVLDVQARCRLYRVDPAGDASSLQLSADGETLIWYRRPDKTFEVHVHRHTANKTFSLPALPGNEHVAVCLGECSCLSPDGRWLLIATEPGHLRRWDLTTAKESSPLTGALRTVWKIIWSPDGRFAAVQVSTAESHIYLREPVLEWRIWDMATGERLRHLTFSHDENFLGFSPDSRTVMITDSIGVIHLREVATGQERSRLLGHLPFWISSAAFRSDGRMLVSGGSDTQMFVWDLTGRMPDGQWRLTQHSPEQRRAYWEALASADAKTAYLAMWQLGADPDGTIAFLRDQVQPIRTPQPGQIARAIAALDSAAFTERERATEELEKLGETVRAELRQTLSQKPSLEARRRIEELLEKHEGVPHGKRLQALRAVEVLEYIGTVPARDMLRKLAEGAAAARLTQEARQALKRSEKTIAP